MQMNPTRIILIFALTVAIAAAVYSNMQAPALQSACVRDSDCMAGGCSGQICTTAAKALQTITTCEWRAEYDCLRLTSCGCASGTCAWRNTNEYQNCLVNITR